MRPQAQGDWAAHPGTHSWLVIGRAEAWSQVFRILKPASLFSNVRTDTSAEQRTNTHPWEHREGAENSPPKCEIAWQSLVLPGKFLGIVHATPETLFRFMITMENDNSKAFTPAS